MQRITKILGALTIAPIALPLCLLGELFLLWANFYIKKEEGRYADLSAYEISKLEQARFLRDELVNSLHAFVESWLDLFRGSKKDEES